jgi:hypothetical protein
MANDLKYKKPNYQCYYSMQILEVLQMEAVVNWSEANLKNLETIDLGQGIHYLQMMLSNK